MKYGNNIEIKFYSLTDEKFISDINRDAHKLPYSYATIPIKPHQRNTNYPSINGRSTFVSEQFFKLYRDMIELNNDVFFYSDMDRRKDLMCTLNETDELLWQNTYPVETSMMRYSIKTFKNIKLFISLKDIEYFGGSVCMDDMMFNYGRQYSNYIIHQVEFLFEKCIYNFEIYNIKTDLYFDIDIKFLQKFASHSSFLTMIAKDYCIATNYFNI